MLACVAIIRKEMANQQCKYVGSAEIEARAKVRRKTMDRLYFVSFVLFSPQAAHDQNAEKALRTYGNACYQYAVSHGAKAM